MQKYQGYFCYYFSTFPRFNRFIPLTADSFSSRLGRNHFPMKIRTNLYQSHHTTVFGKLTLLDLPFPESQTPKNDFNIQTSIPETQRQQLCWATFLRQVHNGPSKFLQARIGLSDIIHCQRIKYYAETESSVYTVVLRTADNWSYRASRRCRLVYLQESAFDNNSNTTRRESNQTRHRKTT